MIAHGESRARQEIDEAFKAIETVIREHKRKAVVIPELDDGREAERGLAKLRAALAEPDNYAPTEISTTLVGLIVAVTILGTIALGMAIAQFYGRF